MNEEPKTPAGKRLKAAWLGPGDELTYDILAQAALDVLPRDPNSNEDTEEALSRSIQAEFPMLSMPDEGWTKIARSILARMRLDLSLEG